MAVRRVVTGHGTDGTSVVVADSWLEPPAESLVPGSEAHQIWANDDTATVPAVELPSPTTAYFPPANGVRFKVVTFFAEASTTTSSASPASHAVGASDSETFPRAAPVEGGDDNPNMHVSDTVDYAFIVAGTITLELDSGEEVELHPGDTVVQQGTRHAWRNRTGEPCVIVSTLVGANRLAAAEAPRLVAGL